MIEPTCIGALVRDQHNRVYVQRRSMTRRLLPGAWDIVGGHIEPGETAEQALAREVLEETGWHLRRIEALVADWKWSHNGLMHRELDYLVEVDGDLNAPRLERGKHDKFYWVGYDDPQGIRSRYDVNNDELWDIIRRATRIRLTNELRLEPISISSADVLSWLCQRGVLALDTRAMPRKEGPAIASGLGQLWDTGLGYSWLAHSRRADRAVIGYGEVTRQRIDGSDQLVLRCAVSADERSLDSAQDIVKALLAFARNELFADQVLACLFPPSQWAREVVGASGMRHAGRLEYAGGHAELFEISFPEYGSYDVGQEVVTGIGQILAVPAG